MKDKNVVILASARKNSDTLKAVVKAIPNDCYTLIDLLDFRVSHYNYDHSLTSNDDFQLIVDKMLQAKTITFATPVYWYSMSGLMKVFLDRFTELLSGGHKIKGKTLKGKDVYLISTGSDEELPIGFEVPFKMTAEYFEMHFKETFYYSSRIFSE